MFIVFTLRPTRKFKDPHAKVKVNKKAPSKPEQIKQKIKDKEKKQFELERQREELIKQKQKEELEDPGLGPWWKKKESMDP